MAQVQQTVAQEQEIGRPLIKGLARHSKVFRIAVFMTLAVSLVVSSSTIGLKRAQADGPWRDYGSYTWDCSQKTYCIYAADAGFVYIVYYSNPNWWYVFWTNGGQGIPGNGVWMYKSVDGNGSITWIAWNGQSWDYAWNVIYAYYFNKNAIFTGAMLGAATGIANGTWNNLGYSDLMTWLFYGGVTIRSTTPDGL